MRLRSKFILLNVVIFTLLFLLIAKLAWDNNYLLIVGELVLLICIGFSIHVYKGFLAPLKLILSGVESIREKDFSIKFVKVGQHEIDQLIEVYGLMIDQLREERLKQVEKHYFLERLIQASPAGIVVFDFDGRVSAINPAAESLLGIKAESIVQRPLSDIQGPLPQRLSILENGSAEIVQVNGVQVFRCQKSHFQDRGSDRHFIIIEEFTREILNTERKAYEKIIRMMSHEVNNSIGAVNSILASCRHYQHQLAEKDRYDYDHVLNVAIDRNKHLARFMANLAEVVRVPAPRKELFNLRNLVESVYTLMQYELEQREITWQWEVEDNDLIANIDIQQMEQVLLNIVKNAMEAIERNGCITVHLKLQPARLVICDNGKGIQPDISQKLFGPFFSTKKDGQGIGLTLTREILMNHGFRFSLETIEGSTAFTIYF